MIPFLVGGRLDLFSGAKCLVSFRECRDPTQEIAHPSESCVLESVGSKSPGCYLQMVGDGHQPNSKGFLLILEVRCL